MKITIIGQPRFALWPLDWQAAQKAADDRAKAEALEKREASSTSGLEVHLKPVAHAYQQLRYQDRDAFKVWVLRQLEKL